MRRPPQAVTDTVPNLAPMVDVIMVLLVFFLLGTSFDLVKQGILQTELDPGSGPGGGQAVQLSPLVRIALVDVNAGQSVAIYVMDQPVGVGDFKPLYHFMAERRRAGADPTNPVVIGAETTVRWKYVVQAMDAAVQAGFKNVQFAVSFQSASAAL